MNIGEVLLFALVRARTAREMDLTLFLLSIYNFAFLIDARVGGVFKADYLTTTVAWKPSFYCTISEDSLAPDDVIAQVFGRVVDTGTGATGTGASGPEDYEKANGATPLGWEQPVPVTNDSGLPLGSVIENQWGYYGHKLVMPYTDTHLGWLGVFYCDINITAEDLVDTAQIQFVSTAKNAVVRSLKKTVTISRGESVTLEMKADNGATGLRWRHDEMLFVDCDDQSSCNVSLAGVYECYYDGERETGLHAIVRVIVRGCPAEMWDPSSGCDKVCVECINGGVCDDEVGDCVCPPGFHGTHCELTCGFDVVGANCGMFLSTINQLLCLPDPYGCSCSIGRQGYHCTEWCDDFHFGVGCAQECHCAKDYYKELVFSKYVTRAECSSVTGECKTGGCAAGWSGYNCQFISPSVVNFTNTKVNSGEPTTFTCVIEAYPRPLESQIVLQRNLSSGNEDVANFNSTDIFYTFDRVNHQAMVTFNVVVHTGEEYTCGVSNSSVAGATLATMSANLFVPPTLVNGPVVDIDNTTQVTVKWTPWSQDTDLGDGPVSKYRVHFSLATQSNFTLYGEATGTSLTVTGLLLENTTYHFAVTAHRDTTGWGDYSPSTAVSLSSSAGLSSGAIGGIVVSLVVVVMLIIVISVLYVRHHHSTLKKERNLEVKEKNGTDQIDPFIDMSEMVKK